MSQNKSGKLHEFSLESEALQSILGLPVFGLIAGYFMSLIGKFTGTASDMSGLPIGCAIIGFCAGIWYTFKQYKFQKEFGIRSNNQYNIDKVIEHFGTPSEIIKDEKCSYYHFTEDVLTFFSREHVFTVDKKGIVTKHELSDIGTKQKD
nr:hypothetical protein [Candidatus Enterousia merdequi]